MVAWPGIPCILSPGEETRPNWKMCAMSPFPLDCEM